MALPALQIADALTELLASFNTANDRTNGRLFADLSDDSGRKHIYEGLTTVLLRVVFLLYAEDLGLMPVENEVYQRKYAVSGLATRLADAPATGLHTSAWSMLLGTFRAVFRGAHHEQLLMPARKGELFDPTTYPFLEDGPPPVSDGTVEAVLSKLTHLEGQRISYKALDVQEIGTVYQALMGFDLRRASSPAIVLTAGRVVELDSLRVPNPTRVLASELGLKPSNIARKAPKLASFRPTTSPENDYLALQDALAGLIQKKSVRIPSGHLYLQPGEERRKSGSHYTPRTLTEPIVRRTLDPLLFGQNGTQVPTSDQILRLKVCDPAMGSGAFLAEAVRYLAKALVDAWGREDAMPSATEPFAVAMRMVVERCIYGVDKNPFAVNLARLSLWLFTRSREAPFTFLDHALRQGDALVGLTLDQIKAFSFEANNSQDRRSAKPGRARVVADLLLACVWTGGSKTQIKNRISFVRRWYDSSQLDEQLPLETLPMRAFHWQLEFPEVWSRGRSGFDAVIGNPPFGGQNTFTAQHGEPYIKLLRSLWPHAHGGADLAAYFFLRLRELMRIGGCAGFISTNTIAQGNTRDTGLKKLIQDGAAVVYAAETNREWPASAAITVSTVFLARGARWEGPVVLNGTAVEAINSFLQEGEELPDPVKLANQPFPAMRGTEIYGNGFVLEQAEAAALVQKDARNAGCIHPYIGGKELNNTWAQDDDLCVQTDKAVICFRDLSLPESAAWPDLMSIVRARVKPERDKLKDNASARQRREKWWRFGRDSPQLYASLSELSFCFCCARVSKHLLIVRQPAARIFSDMVVVFPTEDWAHFAILQSSVHALWSTQFSSTMRDAGVRYSPTRCFENFAFPTPAAPLLERLREAGSQLYRARSVLMQERKLGMTQIWNAVTDESNDDGEINRLRSLRDAVDAVVLEAYGWEDLAPKDASFPSAVKQRLRKRNAAQAQGAGG